MEKLHLFLFPKQPRGPVYLLVASVGDSEASFSCVIIEIQRHAKTKNKQGFCISFSLKMFGFYKISSISVYICLNSSQSIMDMKCLLWKYIHVVPMRSKNRALMKEISIEFRFLPCASTGCVGIS